MLALTFSDGELAFVYSAGRPIGAVRIAEVRGAGRVKLHFAGDESAFEVLRPSVVERRFGRPELVRLIDQFLKD
jgi:hypothetical protein